MALALGIFGVFFILNTAVVLFEKPDTSWMDLVKVGEPAPRDIFAPVSFVLPNEAETAKLRESVAQETPDIYTLDTKPADEIKKRVPDFFDKVRAARTDPSRIKEMAGAFKLNETDLAVFTGIKTLKDLESFAGQTVEHFLIQGIVANKDKEVLVQKNKDILIHWSDDKETAIAPAKLLSQGDAESEAWKAVQDTAKGNKAALSVLGSFVKSFLSPNLSFDEVKTQARRKQLQDGTPPIMDLIKKNEILLEKGKIVTEKDYLRFQEVGKQFTKRKVFSNIFGTSLLIFVTFLLFSNYFYLFEKEVFFDVKNLLLVHSAIFLTLILERFAFLMPSDFVYFTLPASLAALLLSILLNSRIALCGTLIVTVLTAVIGSFRPDIILFTLLGNLAGTYVTVGLRKRSQFLKVGAFIGVVNFLAIFSYWFLNNISVRAAAHLGTLGLANGFLMSVLIFFLIFFFERIFKVTTDITLLELSDLNHPILKRMVLEAPGTYHHTLMIANLCEAAAETIGANPLLARVGSYFHDIGKVAKSQYFTENESVQRTEGVSVQSLHEKMEPLRSNEVIQNHVKEGIDLGKKYKLPKVILDFIPEHQGTCVVYYFYRKALKQHKPEEPPVKEDDYRYPGPKPQSKETAIAMVADSVEASTRSMNDHSSVSLRNNVRKIINEKFTDGQFEECPLTLKDLEGIADSFVRTLKGIYHTRIKYPEKDEKNEEPKPLSD